MVHVDKEIESRHGELKEDLRWKERWCVSSDAFVCLFRYLVVLSLLHMSDMSIF